MKKFLIISIFFIATFLLNACDRSDETEKDRLQVMTTFYPMYEFTKEIVGEEGDVSSLIPSDTNPHAYEPDSEDLEKISASDVLVYNSTELETWVQDLEQNTDTDEILFIEAANQIELMASEETHYAHKEEGDNYSEKLDSHVWLNPELAKKELETIRDMLSEQFPERKAAFEDNAEDYWQELDVIHHSIQSNLKSADNRTLFIQHPVFTYLAEQYDLTQETIPEISFDEEPTSHHLDELKQFIEDNQIEVIYVEEDIPSKTAETLAEETGVSLERLNPIENLTEKQIEAGETYLTIMRDNLQALKESVY